MYIEENAHYSLIKKLKEEFEDDVKVNDSFPKEKLVVPTISIDLLTVDFTKLQIGDYNNIRELSWLIDVFALNKTQRDRAVFKLFSILEEKIPIFDFSTGFQTSPLVEIGALSPAKLRIEFVQIEFEDPEELHYRAAGIYRATIYRNY